jgi:hypothetical protein
MPEETAGEPQESNGYNDNQRRQDKNITYLETLRQEHTANQRQKENHVGTIKSI